MNDELENACLRFNPEAYARAQQRVKTAPLDLTWEDFDQLGTISKSAEREAIEARNQAQLALLQTKSAPVQMAAAPVTKAPETLEELFARKAKQPVNYKTLEVVWNLLFGALKEQKARANALEQRIAEQDSRILDLEAQRAATSKVPV